MSGLGRRRRLVSEMDRRRQLLVAVVTATALGIGALILQRWVAQTFGVAVALVVVWFGVVTVVAFVFARGRPELRMASLGTIGLVAVVSAAGGYWTGVRKDEVNERVAVASARADGDARTAALTGMGSPTEEDAAPVTSERAREPKPTGPVELASGPVSGADGHAGQGTATLIESEDGDRVLTLTGFDVDAGPDVNVYLSESTAGIDGAVDLGDLKGERGDQEYEIPADVDLTRFEDLVLWCIPFTTRIATAELR